MGTLLQVRVSVYTVDPGKVEDAWPVLSRLAYPHSHDYAPAKRGVLELIETLNARITAKEVPGDIAGRLKPGLDKAVQAAAQLQEALALWKPEEAQMITEKIETALDELNDLAG